MIDATHLPIVHRSRKVFTNRRWVTAFRMLGLGLGYALNKVVNTDLVDHKTIFLWN
jgi:hypothetical protein